MKAKSFEFTSVVFKPKDKKAIFRYRINFYDSKSINFTEELILPKVPNLDGVPNNLVNNILDDLHFALGLSYYKLYCPKKIILKNQISRDRASFWNTLYEKGLGEFFYKNKIDYRNIVSFPSTKSNDYTSVSLKRKNRSLVGIGGGKDSIVTLELLKRDKFNINGFVVETGKKYEEVESILKIAKLGSVRINRIIDKKLISNNFPESFNGHIPISSIYAFLGIFSAILYDYKYVVVSNEYSSNFGNIRYLGQEINHQWSKSQEFESLLRDYAHKYLTSDIIYFSLLRPFYEIRIAKLFAGYSKYYKAFSSCNSRFKVSKERTNKKWCGICPKCVFVYTMLTAFL
ncbi:hypothetical protein HGB13_01835, partial [bacterium]|nr:hypothetical protein [bacterium]